MLQALAVPSQKLGTKLVMIVTGFLLVALVAIGLTLLVSWDLEGGAAAVNAACWSCRKYPARWRSPADRPP